MLRLLLAAGLWLTLTLATSAADRKLNVLFIAVDDLRPELGCYGTPIIQSPNIDALAKQGMIFNRAYCQQAVCSPTRSSLMTGRRPDTTRVYDLVTHFRKAIPDVVTLPQHFKAAGWHTQSFGKIYHPGYDDPASWSVPSWLPNRPDNSQPDAANRNTNRPNRPADGEVEIDEKSGLVLKGARPVRGNKGKAVNQSPKGDSELPDGMTADAAIAFLKEKRTEPFFLAVGFAKPHLPFNVPKKYYDLYDPQAIPLAKTSSWPEGSLPFSGTNSGELRGYNDMPKGKEPFTEAHARALKHGYYASVSYMDAQLGRLMAELDAQGLRDNTVIILWGDHGWKLGEHGEWCKHTNWEPDTRCTLLLSVPGQKSAGQTCHRLVEFVDVYPTLCELCGIDLATGHQGTSFAPLVTQPDKEWKTAAFSQYPRGKVMGYAMRTPRYRYVEWKEDGEVKGRELYDYETDPDETRSIADDPAQASLIKSLSAQLNAGWQAARPKS